MSEYYGYNNAVPSATGATGVAGIDGLPGAGGGAVGVTGVAGTPGGLGATGVTGPVPTGNMSFNSFYATATTASTSPDTGAVVIDGGVGVVGDINVGGDVTVGGITQVSTVPLPAPLSSFTFGSYIDMPNFTTVVVPTNTTAITNNTEVGGIITIPGLVIPLDTTITIVITDNAIANSLMIGGLLSMSGDIMYAGLGVPTFLGIQSVGSMSSTITATFVNDSTVEAPLVFDVTLWYLLINPFSAPALLRH